MAQRAWNDESRSQPRWRPWRSKGLWSVILGMALFRLAVSWAFRTKNPAVIGRIKRFNRRWLNPWMLHLAGGPRWYAGRLEHRGRRTGRIFATPLLVNRVPGGFAMPLPYGRDVDWARNLLATGDGVLLDHGIRSRVGNPRIVPAEDLLPDLPLVMHRAIATYGIRDFMRVDALPNASAVSNP
jgi:hypothetical protein